MPVRARSRRSSCTRVLRPSVARPTQPVQLLRVARTDEPAVVQGRRRRVHQRRAAARVGRAARSPASGAASRRQQLGTAAVERRRQIRQHRQAPPEARQVPRACRGPVARRPRIRSTSATCRSSPAQASRQTALVDSSSTASCRARMASRSSSGASSHSAQPARAERGDGAVHHTQQRASPASRPRMVRRTSRLARVVSSRTSVDSSGTRRSAWTWRASVRWVSLR